MIEIFIKPAVARTLSPELSKHLQSSDRALMQATYIDKWTGV